MARNTVPGARTGRPVTAGVIAAILLGMAVMVMSVSETAATRSDDEFAGAEVVTTVDPRFDVEASADLLTWTNDPATVLPADFSAEAMALQVGEANAVYAPMHLRAAAGTNLAGTAVLTETALPQGGFPDALRAQVYADAPECSETGTAGGDLVASGALRGLTSSMFEVGPPAVAGEAGPVQSLCVKVWLDNNDFLLGGEQSGVQTARWLIDATADEV